jgi:RND family efflux transporter MFP subunit
VSDREIEPEEERRWSRARPGSGRRRQVLLIAGAVLLAVVALGVGAKAVQALFKTKGNLARMAGLPLQVKIAQVTAEDINEVIGGTTLAEGFQQLQVISVVSEGKVLAVKTDLGQLVKPGDVMLEFDPNVFQQVLDRAKLTVQAARANLKKLEAERDTRLSELKAAVATSQERLISSRTTEDTTHKMYDRNKALFDKQVVALVDLEQAKMKWDDARTALSLTTTDLLRAQDALKNEALIIQALIDAARATVGLALQDLAQAQKDMGNTKVIAPAVAVVSARKVNPGEWVKGPQILFTADRVEPIYATAQIEQEKSAYVSVGQEGEVVFDSYPTRIMRGKIYKIDPTIDPARRTFKAYVLLQNPSLELRGGMAAFTRLKSSRHVVLVPRLAVINPTGAPAIDATVFVVEDGKAVARKVKLGKSEGLGRVEVFSGLRDGEWVVIHGNKDLNPGDRVDAEKVVALKDGKLGKVR